MTRPVSVVLPSLDLPELLEANLPPLLEELERRGAGDEVVVVDDTGRGVVARHVEEHFAGVVAVARDENGGFSAAMNSGIRAAKHDLIFSMNTDVRVRPGFLDPLVETLGAEDVGAVVPLVYLHGQEDELESLNALEFRDGDVRFVQPNLPDHVGERLELGEAPVDVGFAVGGTVLFSRELYVRLGGFDPAFEPFYWEDIDLSWRMWRAGLRVVLDPRSAVDHMHRGTIGKVVSRELVRCMLEKNRLLFAWKHLDRPALKEHVAGLYRRIVDARVTGDRESLVSLCYALEEAAKVLAAREDAPPGDRSFEQLARRCDPRRR